MVKWALNEKSQMIQYVVKKGFTITKYRSCHFSY